MSIKRCHACAARPSCCHWIRARRPPLGGRSRSVVGVLTRRPRPGGSPFGLRLRLRPKCLRPSAFFLDLAVGQDEGAGASGLVVLPRRGAPGVVGEGGSQASGGIRGGKQGRQQRWETSGHGGRDRGDLTVKEAEVGGVCKGREAVDGGAESEGRSRRKKEERLLCCESQEMLHDPISEPISQSL